MSSEWAQCLTISELISRDGGSIKTGPFGTSLKASEYASQGVPLISVREIGCGTFHVDARTPRVAEATLQRLPEYILEEGDIVFARKGGIERSAMVGRGERGWFLGSDGIRLRPPKSCHARFLAYSLQTKSVRDWLTQNSTGSTMASLNQATIGRLPIVLPSYVRQMKVAQILGALDDRITLLRETHATLEAIAQALFNSWFIDFDPVRAKQQGLAPAGMDEATATLFPDYFDASAHGPLPGGWRIGKVEDILELAYGKALKSADRIPGEVPVYGSGGITGFHKTALADAPAVVVGRKGTIGSLYWEDRPCFPIDTVFYVRAKVPLTFCFYQLGVLGLATMNTDGAVPGLNRTNVYRLPVTIPSFAVLNAFDNIVSRLQAKIFGNESQAQTLATLRDTLLPRLISGQLRLPEAEALIEETA